MADATDTSGSFISSLASDVVDDVSEGVLQAEKFAASLAKHFNEECIKKTAANAKLLLNKLSDPASFLKESVSGPLVDAASQGPGALAQFGETYLKQNAAGAAVAILKATGTFNKVTGALNMALGLVSSLFALYNDIVFLYMKKVAQNAIKELKAKDAVLAEVNALIAQLLAALQSYDAADPVFEAYLKRLRQGLVHVNNAYVNAGYVQSGLAAPSPTWLSAYWSTVKKELNLADGLMKPLDRGKNPYLQLTANGLATNLGLNKLTAVAGMSKSLSAGNANEKNVKTAIGTSVPGIDKSFYKNQPPQSKTIPPDQEAQIINTLSIPAITNMLLVKVQSYFHHTSNANALIEAWRFGVTECTNCMPAAMTIYAKSLVDQARGQMASLQGSMAQTLNGDQGQFQTPLRGFEPTPLNVSVNAYKWILQLHGIIALCQTVPDDALNSAQLDNNVLGEYERLVNKMNLINDYQNGPGIVIGVKGTEQLAALESQLFNLMVQANTGLISSGARHEAMALATAIYARNAAALERDGDIEKILTTWINTTIPNEADLKRIQDEISRLLKALKLDRAADMLSGGALSKFFTLNGMEATYAGAALLAISLLKQCLTTEEDQKNLDKVQADVQKTQDLLNINLSFNFDLAILKNIADCLKLTNLASLWSLQEVICNIVQGVDKSVGKALQSLQDQMAGQDANQPADISSGVGNIA